MSDWLASTARQVEGEDETPDHVVDLLEPGKSQCGACGTKVPKRRMKRAAPLGVALMPSPEEDQTSVDDLAQQKAILRETLRLLRRSKIEDMDEEAARAYVQEMSRKAENLKLRLEGTLRNVIRAEKYIDKNWPSPETQVMDATSHSLTGKPSTTAQQQATLIGLARTVIGKGHR